jgi:hypothetical protein
MIAFLRFLCAFTHGFFEPRRDAGFRHIFRQPSSLYGFLLFSASLQRLADMLPPLRQLASPSDIPGIDASSPPDTPGIFFAAAACFASQAFAASPDA